MQVLKHQTKQNKRQSGGVVKLVNRDRKYSLTCKPGAPKTKPGARGVPELHRRAGPRAAHQQAGAAAVIERGGGYIEERQHRASPRATRHQPGAVAAAVGRGGGGYLGEGYKKRGLESAIEGPRPTGNARGWHEEGNTQSSTVSWGRCGGWSRVAVWTLLEEVWEWGVSEQC